MSNNLSPETPAAPPARLLSVLMPVYNESRTLRRIVARVLASPVSCDIEVICVDDCSNDHSFAILQELAAADARVKAYRQPANQGKGAAIHAAIGHMTGDIAIIQDADLEYDPQDYPAMLAPILEGRADAVFGSRFAFSGQRRLLFFWHALGNRVLSLLANVLNDLNMTDMETCYKAVRADVLRQIPLKSKRFGFEPELTTRLAQMNLRLYEVPISYHGRTQVEGKKIAWQDGVEAIWCLLKFRFLDTRFTTHDGYYFLESVRRARGFNRWMHEQFAPHVGPRVLEAACGIGNFTELLLDRERLICTDADPFFIEMIGRRFGHLENVRLMWADPARASDDDALRDERIDSIVCCNVLEHVERDEAVLSHYFDTLQPGGRVIVFVPAHAALFSKIDNSLGHRRRYAADKLRAKMRRAGFDVVNLKEFNRLGAWGWRLNKWLGRSHLSPRQVKLFEWFIPLARLMDWLKLGRGLSLIAVGQRPPVADIATAGGNSSAAHSASVV